MEERFPVVLAATITAEVKPVVFLLQNHPFYSVISFSNRIA